MKKWRVFLAQSERDTPNPETLNSKGLDANLKKEEKEKKKSGLSAHAQTNKQSSVVWSVAATLQRYLHNPPPPLLEPYQATMRVGCSGTSAATATALAVLLAAAPALAFSPAFIQPNSRVHVAPTVSSYVYAPSKSASALTRRHNKRRPAVVVRSSAATEAEAIALMPNGERSSSVGKRQLNRLQSTLTKVGLILFLVSMCLVLPMALLPPFLAEKVGFIDRLKREQYALRSGCFCSRWLMRLIPFANKTVVPFLEDDPEPSVWVCNHTSMLDIFVLLATDKKLRGKNRRPIKIVYWKGLEENPVTKLLFTQCGMIPVSMADNGNGNANEYDTGSFKRLLRDMKAAFADGFDIGESIQLVA